MDSLYTTADTVKRILETDVRARSNDNYLYLQVIKEICERTGQDIRSMTAEELLLNAKKYGFPAFESVRRSRQKVQHDYPELSGTNEVEAHRKVKEEEYKRFATAYV